MAESDIASLSETTRRLITDLQNFLDAVEPIISRHRTNPNEWSADRHAELHDTCNQVHYLWTRLDILEQHLRD